ncbi:MAG: sulfatase-like hydrolase/transferase [Thermoleophilaceae bacterium]
MRLTRRTLLASAGVLPALGLPARAVAQEQGRRALLVVLPLVRDDYADTPNIKELKGDSLRFDRVIPECMPALPVRRTLITGMRSFPFRDWKRTEGMPAVPGYNPVWDWQPVMTETMRSAGIRTTYVTDNPIFAGARFPDVRGAGGRQAAGGRGGVKDEIAAIARATDATERTFRTGIEELRGLSRGGSFFLGIDPFDLVDAFEAPPIYVQSGEVDDEGIGPMDGRLVEIRSVEVDELRSAYRDHVEAVDEWVGRLMGEVPDDVLVFMLGDIGIALGEHDYIGRGTPTSHRESYEIPFLIRDPDGRKSGDDVDWYASTHDVAPTILSYLGITIPGKMWGEDLTALLDDVDEDDLYNRPFSITASGSLIVVRDKRWLMVADREEIERRLYDDDEEVEDDITRFQDVANEDPGQLTDMSLAALAVAGGTLPEFGPDGAVRPPRERGDDDTDDDGIPNDFDAVDNDESDDNDDREALEFDGRDAEDLGAARP